MESLTKDENMRNTEIRENLKIIKSENHGIRFIDLTNAGLNGKTCSEVYVDVNFGDYKEAGQRFCDLCHNMKSAALGPVKLESVRTFKDACQFAEVAEALLDAKVYFEERKANRVFPVNDLSRIKPLKKMPKKWTLPLVVRCLVNGQFTDLRCKGKFTDDYAYDNHINFARGDFSGHALKFAKDIFENPQGWHASDYNYQKDGSISISCHSFDLNEFKPKIEGAA